MIFKYFLLLNFLAFWQKKIHHFCVWRKVGHFFFIFADSKQNFWKLTKIPLYLKQSLIPSLPPHGCLQCHWQPRALILPLWPPRQLFRHVCVVNTLRIKGTQQTWPAYHHDWLAHFPRWNKSGGGGGERWSFVENSSEANMFVMSIATKDEVVVIMRGKNLVDNKILHYLLKN